MKDWSIEQLGAIEMELENGKRIYIGGEPCIISHMALVQPPLVANHPGDSLEIDAIDPHGNTHEVRLYTPDWPEDRR